MNVIRTYSDSHRLPGTPDSLYLATGCDAVARSSSGIPDRSFLSNPPFARIVRAGAGFASISRVQKHGSRGIIFVLQSHARYRATIGNQLVSVQR
jgi:hypothetical protein